MWILSRLLTQFIRNGTMRLIDAADGVHLFGGSGPGPNVTLRLHDPALYRKLALNPELQHGAPPSGVPCGWAITTKAGRFCDSLPKP